MSREQQDSVLERLRAALDELADAEAATLVAEAHVEARARVRSMLAEAIAERLLDSAEAELAALAAADPLVPAMDTGARRELRRERADLPRGSVAPPHPRGTPAEKAPGAPTSAPAAAPLAREEDRRPRGEGWYVYGIVEQGFEPHGGAGLEEADDLEVVTGAGLGALVRRVSLEEFGEEPLRERMEDVPWLERSARRHEDVLERVREQRVTVVPMRLFTIYESTESLRAMLTREQRYLADALSRLACRTEWGVKLYLRADAAALDDAGEGEQHQEAQAGPGESYMLRRRTADRRREEAARRLDDVRNRAHERLAKLAVEARVNQLQPPELSDHDGTMLMNGVYLVDDDALSAFRECVGALREELAARGIDVLLTGPWPPYNFVNSAQGAEA